MSMYLVSKMTLSRFNCKTNAKCYVLLNSKISLFRKIYYHLCSFSMIPVISLTKNLAQIVYKMNEKLMKLR